MSTVDRQRVAGIGGERGRVGISQIVQRGVIERRLESGQISGRQRLPQRTAIAEVELETTVAKHGEVTGQGCRITTALEPYQCSWRVARQRGRFTATGSKNEEDGNRDTSQLQGCCYRLLHPGVNRSPSSCDYAAHGHCTTCLLKRRRATVVSPLKQ